MFSNHIVYIIGFMGSGKSTAGRKLASLLGWTFTDLDVKITEYTGMTIPEIFSQKGEDYFRNAESEVLKSLKNNSNCVISTGGGTPCHCGNMDFMLESGLTIYLKMTPAQLKKRLKGSTTQRPLLKELNNKELNDFIEAKLAEREKWYNRAEFIVDGFDLDINFLQNIVKNRLKI
jgi:shikimate kinase